ncbi:hypothetical protein L9G74_07705 [Shewanella sp. C32]|uniref:Transposase n=1 Tax=Shewanella electrica TaxID=515560 RepID=A0ABT2FJ04_9GAMM|nr:hypothetical protein [Shewanella electrica]MCH1924416.1 hypothetical protein [Shewanella electrica]MCS4556317.1 hypothetical protein [Shewanella electrica]
MESNTVVAIKKRQPKLTFSIGAVYLYGLIFVQIEHLMNEARPATLSQLSKLGATKFKRRLNEPFGQRQSEIYSALGAVCGE